MFNSKNTRLGSVLAILATSLWMGLTNQLFGQQLVTPAEAKKPDLNIPVNAKAVAAKNKNVLVRTTKGDTLVAKLNCTIDDKALVTLPSGQLSFIDRAHTRPTDKSFKPSGKAMKQLVTSSGFGKYKTASSKPYIFVYGCSKEFYQHTRSILDTMYPGVVANLKSWGLKVNESKIPLLVVIMPDRKSFDRFSPTPPSVVAYYNIMTNMIVMYEDTELFQAAPEYALKQASYVIAHEGVHQLLANTSIQRRLARWPIWMSEGLPEYFCPLKVSSRIVQKGLARMPVRSIKWTKAGMVNDLRMFELLQVPPGAPGETIRAITQTDQLDSRGYSLSWGLVHYFAKKQPAKFKAYLQALSKRTALQHTPSNASADGLFEKHFGSDYAAIEKAVQEHLTSSEMEKEYIDPFANQTHYVIKRIAKKGRAFSISLMTTTSPDAAKKWRAEQEKQFKRAQFYSFICKNEKEALYQIQKLQKVGRR